ncbi:MAG: hypothetical protein COA82_10605 [Alkaliphilus sp.]|nr:MAG: hypothetical protein COA82_10605 [Alkaliphilus sp.]
MSEQLKKTDETSPVSSEIISMMLGTTIAAKLMVVPFLGQNFRMIPKRTVPDGFIHASFRHMFHQ